MDKQTRLFAELPNRSARIAVFKVNTNRLEREFPDIAATEMISLNDPFMVVKRLSKDHSGVIAAEDGNDEVIDVRAIEWTDCHEVEWKSYLADRVLMATSKH
ncbi:MAG TPA: hypothetical protein VLU73_03925 [Methylococcaceae bacterium]|nr:hypothetical protein [Methylococcaceae bacterium]